METVIQNTEEWHKLRGTRIGASEANIIMGVSEYTSPRQLHELKVNPPEGERKENNFIQAKGHRTEPRLRAYVEMLYDGEFPDVVALSQEHDWLMASLDGCCSELEILAEFKLVGEEDYQLVKSGKWLPQYYPQIQQQLLVTGYKMCVLVVGAADKEAIEAGDKHALKFAHLEVFPDIEYISKELFPALKKFWDGVKSKTPPAYSQLDIVDLSGNADLSAMLERYRLTLEESEEVEGRLEKLKSEIFKLTTKTHFKVKCDGVTVYDIQNKDGLKTDYEKFIEDQKLVVPAEYCKVTKGARTKKITFPKAKKEDPQDSIVPGASIPEERPKKAKKAK